MNRARTLLTAFGRGALWWLFGICATVLLISLWGRAVASDQQAVTEAARQLAQTNLVVEQLVTWVLSGADLAPVDVEATVTQIVQIPDLRRALSLATDAVVEAAFQPGGSADVGAILTPLAPRLTAALVEYGVQIDEPAVHAALEGLPPIRFGTAATTTTVAARMSRPLTTASLVATVALVTMGALLVGTSTDRLATLRALALRVVISALSFGVILRIASWIADPSGGASPMRRTVSVVLRSRAEVPLLMAAAALVVVGSVVLIAKNRSPRRQQ